VAEAFLPELTSPTAIDAAALVDRILSEFIVEEEDGAALSAEFGAEFAHLLRDTDDGPVTPESFHQLRRRAAEVVAETAGSDDAGERERSRRLIDVERRFLERVDELRRSVLEEDLDAGGDSGLAECSVSTEQLTTYLRHRLPRSPDVTVTSMEVVPGGRSKETILVSLEGTDELPPDIIVRKDRPVGLLPTKASDEFAILKAVYDHGGVPVPEPFFADGSPQELGEGTLLVMARVGGVKAGEYFPDLAAPTTHKRELGEQLAAALAHLHAVPLSLLGSTNLNLEQEVTEDTVAMAVEGMATRIGQLSGPPIASVPMARRWLLEHASDAVPSGPLCLLQGDVGLHNMLIENGRLTALVDWEGATIGPPVRELAAAWPAATALMAWDDFVDAYGGAGGPVAATDSRGVTYYRVFMALGACMSSRTGGDLFRSGAKRDLLTAHSGLDAHFRAQRNLARALGDALGRG
jgi:aminoglycoside phosphotransferase (APT) family kinase protein